MGAGGTSGPSLFRDTALPCLPISPSTSHWMPCPQAGHPPGGCTPARLQAYDQVEADEAVRAGQLEKQQAKARVANARAQKKPAAGKKGKKKHEWSDESGGWPRGGLCSGCCTATAAVLCCGECRRCCWWCCPRVMLLPSATSGAKGKSPACLGWLLQRTRPATLVGARVLVMATAAPAALLRCWALPRWCVTLFLSVSPCAALARAEDPMSEDGE